MTFFACFCVGKEGRDYPSERFGFYGLRFFVMIFVVLSRRFLFVVQIAFPFLVVYKRLQTLSYCLV